MKQAKVDRRHELRNTHIYALYRGDEYLMDGTLDEIAAKRGCKRSTLQWMLYPTYRKRYLEGRRKDGRPHVCLALTRLDDEKDAE